MTDNKPLPIPHTITSSPPSTSTNTNDIQALMYDSAIGQLKKAKDKISKDIDSPEFSELIVNNMTELLALRAIRDHKKALKIAQTQKIMNGFRKHL
jgi:hypothetical protein